MRKKWILVLLFMTQLIMAASSAGADELPAQSQQEIAHLLQYLESSGCQFNRNGTWYDAVAAKEHINKKYQYLLDKHQLTSAESFIEKAATESSMSGKAYLVKCGSGEASESAAWFRAELQKYRTAHTAIH